MVCGGEAGEDLALEVLDVLFRSGSDDLDKIRIAKLNHDKINDRCSRQG